MNNQPASLGTITAFRENPFPVKIVVPASHPLTETVTVELWDNTTKMSDAIAVTKTGQDITFTLSPANLANLGTKKTPRLLVKFDTTYIFAGVMKITMDGTFPSATFTDVTLPNIGTVRVVFTGFTGDAEQFAKDAKESEDNIRILTAEAKTARDQANAILATTPSQYKAMGYYSPTGNTPTLTATPGAVPTGEKPMEYEPTVGGVMSFAGANFASGRVIAEGERLRQTYTNQWYIGKVGDLGLTIAKQLDINLLPVVPVVKTTTTGTSAGGATVSEVNSTVTIPNGQVGTNAVIYKTFDIDLTKYPVGTSLAIFGLIGENKAGMYMQTFPGTSIYMFTFAFNLHVVRNGVQVNNQGTNLGVRQRKDSNHVYHTRDYTIQEGDTSLIAYIQIVDSDANYTSTPNVYTFDSVHIWNKDDTPGWSDNAKVIQRIQNQIDFMGDVDANLAIEASIKKQGPEIDGDNQTSVADSSQVVFNNPLSLATVEGRVKKFFIWLSAGGTFFLSKGRLTTPKFEVEKIIGKFTGVAGLNEITLNEYVKVGEIIGLGGENGGTATVRFGGAGVTGNRFYQKNTNASTFAQGGAGSYYAFWYEIETHPGRQPIYDSIVSKQTLNQDLIDYVDSDTLGDVITLGVDTIYDTETATLSGDLYYTNSDSMLVEGKAHKISINLSAAGTIRFVIGIVDQNKIVVEFESFTRTAVVGLNEFIIDKPITTGQQIIVKTPYAGKLRYQTGVTGKSFLRSPSSGYTNALEVVLNAYLSMKVEVYEVIEKPVATSKSIKELEEKVAVLQVSKPTIIFSKPGNFKFRVVCDDDGANLRTENIYSYNKAIVLGNSITRHDITEIWWGYWGMAASERSKDFVHVFEAMVKSNKPTFSVSAGSITPWEQNHATISKAFIDAYFTGTEDLVIIRAGENASATGLQASMESLIDYVRTKAAPGASVVVSGVFWTDDTKDIAMSAAAAVKGCTYVPLSFLNTPENRSYIGAIVKGEGGENHTVTNGAVAYHPGDLGMKRIAEALFTSIFE